MDPTMRLGAQTYFRWRKQRSDRHMERGAGNPKDLRGGMRKPGTVGKREVDRKVPGTGEGGGKNLARRRGETLGVASGLCTVAPV